MYTIFYLFVLFSGILVDDFKLLFKDVFECNEISYIQTHTWIAILQVFENFINILIKHGHFPFFLPDFSFYLFFLPVFSFYLFFMFYFHFLFVFIPYCFFIFYDNFLMSKMNYFTPISLSCYFSFVKVYFPFL